MNESTDSQFTQGGTHEITHLDPITRMDSSTEPQSIMNDAQESPHLTPHMDISPATQDITDNPQESTHLPPSTSSIANPTNLSDLLGHPDLSDLNRDPEPDYIDPDLYTMTHPPTPRSPSPKLEDEDRKPEDELLPSIEHSDTQESMSPSPELPEELFVESQASSSDPAHFAERSLTPVPIRSAPIRHDFFNPAPAGRTRSDVVVSPIIRHNFFNPAPAGTRSEVVVSPIIRPNFFNPAPAGTRSEVVVPPIANNHESTVTPAMSSVAGDDDDDIMEIDPRDLPADLKRKWQAHAPIRPIMVAVKCEPELVSSPRVRNFAQLPERSRNSGHSHLPGAPGRETQPVNGPRNVPETTSNGLAAKQRQMLQKMQQRKTASRATAMPTKKSSENPKKRRHEARFEGQLVPDDPAQVDAAMRDGEEDHTWMDVEDEEEVDEEDERMQMLLRRENNGKINAAEKLELSKLKRAKKLKARLRTMANEDGEEEPEEESLFVQETREDILRRHRRDRPKSVENTPEPEEDGDRGVESRTPSPSPHPDEDHEDAQLLRMLGQELNGGLDGVPTEEELKSTAKGKKGKAGKKATARPKNAREVRAAAAKKAAAKTRQKLNKKMLRTAAINPRDRNKKTGKGAPSIQNGKSAKGKKGTSPAGARSDYENYHRSNNALVGQSRDDVAQMILDNLMSNDPISDRMNDPIFNVESEAEISGRQKKDTQLALLFQNIPLGTSQSVARSDKTKLKEASKSFGYAKVRAVDGKWLVKGMKSTLYHHQLLGAQWMVSRELADAPPYGGLLADGMGLGKTVQTLACMVGNPPAPADLERNVRATLIVVPSAVIDQWLDEIRTHAETAQFPKIMHYKTSSKIPITVLQDLDIVLCSYNEVMKQFPFPDQKARDKIAQMGYQKWWSEASGMMGDLHKVQWYRVVLDEAHAIKNNSARTSLACQNLKSLYRWCLTGTPLLNRLEELFPYLRFLKANYSMDWKTFQRHFCDPDADDCHQRIATLLSYTMMRRTMKTTILNRPIITLPPPHPEIKYVEFSTEERIIYRITENRFRANLNAFFKDKGINKQQNYIVFLVQLLRLRQCTSHPFMLERTIKESWTVEDVNELKRRFKQLKRDNTQPFYEQCKLWVTQSEAERQQAQEARARGEVPENMEANPFGRSMFGHKFVMDKALKSLSDTELYSRVVCALCSDIPMQPTATDCGHIFCKDCLSNYMHAHCAEYDDEQYICPSCDKMFTTVTPYELDILNDDDMSEGSSQSSNKRRKTKGSKSRDSSSSLNPDSKGRDRMGFEPSTKKEDSTWIARSDHEKNFDLVPSAKTAALKSILLKGFEEAPLDKVVIYVQFRLLARIVGRICAGEDWGFLYLTGDSSLDHRSKVVKAFRGDPEIKILIAGLKCGGLGLNFPWANRCISLDLWWNHAVEQQAFGRIFRIGQFKETYMTRIVVRNTVDMRLLAMQMYKLKTCERAMRDGEKTDNPVLNLADLARLFGFLKTDEDGEIIGVEADYDDGEMMGLEEM